MNDCCCCVLHINVIDRVCPMPHASTIPSHVRGCQSSTGTWSAGQENIRGISTKLQREYGKKKQKKQTDKRNNESSIGSK